MIAGYRAQVQAHLARHKRYPESARDRGVEGRTTVSFTLARSGAVVAVSLARSSGSGELDAATLDAVRRASPFPPIPPGGPATMPFTVPLRYGLD